jgi:acetyl-CoA carboxylase biotin carboxyl carrier protein
MSALKVDPDLIRSLAALLDETGLSEIELAEGNARVRVARPGPAGPAGGHAEHAVPLSGQPAPVLPPHAMQVPAEPPGLVKSPLVGTVYLAPEPGAAAFIKAGDSVAEGQTLALIEAMKTFNPVRAPRAGRVVRILVSDGMPVEYGEGLMILE